MPKVHEVTDSTTIQDGEVTTTRRDVQYRISTEEDYIKLYVRTMSILHNVEGAAVKTLNEVLKRIGYDNKIVLAPSIKQQIADDAGLKKNTVEHHLIALCKQNLLIKEATNVYLINTYVFGRGKWADIIESRKDLPVNLVFTEHGVDFE